MRTNQYFCKRDFSLGGSCRVPSWLVGWAFLSVSLGAGMGRWTESWVWNCAACCWCAGAEGERERSDLRRVRSAPSFLVDGKGQDDGSSVMSRIRYVSPVTVMALAWAEEAW